MNESSTNPEIQVVIADDHPIFRRGLRGMIEAEADLKVVADADNGTLAVEQICQLEPDIAVLDLDMPGKDGFAVAREIREKHLACEIVFLTMHNSEAIFNAALDLGVKGYVLKDSALHEIIDCIRHVAAGRSYISPQLTTLLLNRANRAAEPEKNVLETLTPSELGVLKLIADEKSTRQIADELFISIRTVDRHRSNICDKLDLHGPNALFKFAIANKEKLK